MSDHQEFLALLAVRNELPAEQRGRLDIHLAGCAACRDTARFYAENCRRLRTLEPIAPPRDLRERVLDSVDRTSEVIGLYAPFVFACGIAPLSLVAAAVVLIYGLIAWIALFAAIGLFAYLIARRYPSPEPASNVDLPEPAGRRVRRLLRTLTLDIAGVLAGAAFLSLALALLAIAQQGHLAFGG